MKEKKLVYGVGINDADYVVKSFRVVGYRDTGKPIQEVSWICPFYQKWRDMIRRCYSEAELIKHPSYTGCSVSSDWLHFMTFRSWMVEQDWENKHLDKDLLISGNKIYSADTCVFIDKKINKFISDKNLLKINTPIGVSEHKRKYGVVYRAMCTNAVTGENEYLGIFDTPEEAHHAWLTFKLEQAKILASQQTDPRVATAIINRYQNYTDYLGELK